MWRSKKGVRCGALRRMVHTTVRLSSVASLPSKPFPAPNSTTNEDFPSNPRLRSCPTSDSNCNLDVRRTWMNSTHKIHGVAHSGCATHVDVQSAQNAAAFAHTPGGRGGRDCKSLLVDGAVDGLESFLLLRHECIEGTGHVGAGADVALYGSERRLQRHARVSSQYRACWRGTDARTLHASSAATPARVRPSQLPQP